MRKFWADRHENPGLSLVLIKMPGFVLDSPLCGGDALIYWGVELVEVGLWGLHCLRTNSSNQHPGVSFPAALNSRNGFCHSGLSHRQRNG